MSQASQTTSNIQESFQHFIGLLQAFASQASAQLINTYTNASVIIQDWTKQAQSKMESSPPFRHFVYVFLTLSIVPVGIFLLVSGSIVLSAVLAFILGFVTVTGGLLAVGAVGLLGSLFVALSASLVLVGILYLGLFGKETAVSLYRQVIEFFSATPLPLKPQNGPKYD